MNLKRLIPVAIKRQIKNFLFRQKIRQTHPLRLSIGSAGIQQEGWIATEISHFNLLQPQQWRNNLGAKSIDAIMAEHVWEHLTLEEGVTAAKTCWTFLKPGGKIRIAVPDGYFPNPKYIDMVRPGGWGDGSDDHKVLFNHKNLSEIFERAGFKVELLEYFDDKGEFHQRPWDPTDGFISRSRQNDPRNTPTEAHYTSIILDAIKPT